MVLDINLLREDRGGNPGLVKESQQRRFASVDLVTEVQEADQAARKGTHFIHSLITKNNKTHNYIK
jgi:seryl-tRNA synthetase